MRFLAVIFDLGGVVLGSPLTAFEQYERQAGLPPQTVNRVIGAAGAGGAWARLERGELSMEEFFQAFDQEVAELGERLSARDVMQAVEAHTPVRWEVVAAIRRLRSAGLRAGALTNNWLSADQTQKMNALRPEFDVFIESARVGLRKPDPRIYELACEQLDAPPSQVVFLDDLGINLKPARGMGMTTIKVSDPHAALQVLAETLSVPLSA